MNREQLRNLCGVVLTAALLLTGLAAFAQAAGEDAPPVLFETGLVSELPAGRLEGLLVGIDPGHQAHENAQREPIAPGSKETKIKVSSGATGVFSKTPEHVVNLQVSFKLKQALEDEGAAVLMTRETADIDISNVERAVMMNEAGADIVLRIHCNSTESAKPHGTALYVRKNGAKAKESDEAARVILRHMIAATNAQDRGVVHNDSYTGLNWSEVPSILVEMGFMSNPAEDALLNDPAYQDKLVSGMVEGIAEYFGRAERQS